MSEAHSKFLVPYCLSNLVSSKKTAFTLAEVLITLGIIGVVAAMTIPTLVANYKEKELVNQAKTGYSIIQNAVQITMAQNGFSSYRDIFSLNLSHLEILELLTQNLSVTKICNTGDKSCWPETIKFEQKKYNNGVTYGKTMYYAPTAVLKNGMRIMVQRFNYQGNCNYTYTAIKKDEAGNPIINEETGEQEIIYYTTPRCGQIIIDVNGPAGPNQLGADTFDLGIYPDSTSLYNTSYTFMKDGKLHYEPYELYEEYKN